MCVAEHATYTFTRFENIWERTGMYIQAHLGTVRAVFLQSSLIHAGTFLNTKWVAIRTTSTLTNENQPLVKSQTDVFLWK